MSLVQLPYELVSYVIGPLDLDDIHSLSLSCKRFQYLVHEPNIAKVLLEVISLITPLKVTPETPTYTTRGKRRADH